MPERHDTDSSRNIEHDETSASGDSFDALMREVAGVGEAPIRPDAAFVAGTRVTDRVQLVRLLGRGGMGSVWVADHLTLERQVAVKFVLQDSGREALDRFSREAKLAAKLNSPHAVRVFDHGTMDAGIPFIVMELLEGESLADRLSSTGRLTVAEVVLLVKQVAQVLSEAHGLGIVHRDIKPANLLLTESAYDLFVKVLDFGVAKQHAEVDRTALTNTGALVGTPLYMAPEQLVEGQPANAQADLWALATVAYEALTGHAPFTGRTVAAIGAALMRRDFDDPTVLRPGLPPEAKGWFERAFAEDVSARFSHPTELADTFAALLDGVADTELAETVASKPGRNSSASRARPAVTPPVDGEVSQTMDPVAGASHTAPAPKKWYPLGALALVAAGAVGVYASQLGFDRASPGPAPSTAASAPPAANAAVAPSSAPIEATSTPTVTASADAPPASPPIAKRATTPPSAPPVARPGSPRLSPPAPATPSAPEPAQAPQPEPSPASKKKGGLIEDTPF